MGRSRSRRNTTSNDEGNNNPFRNIRRKRAQSDAVFNYTQTSSVNSLSSSPASLKGRISRIKSKLLMSGTSINSQTSQTTPIRTGGPVFVVADDDEEEEEEEEEAPVFTFETGEDLDAREEEDQVGEEEEQDGDDYEDGMEDFFRNNSDDEDNETSIPPHRSPSFSILQRASDYKWNPLATSSQSASKQLRNCLRCIKPLNADDSWVGKSLVRPTTLSPLNLLYLRNMRYNGTLGSSNSSSCSSLASLNTTNSIGFKRRSFTIKDIPQFETSLLRTPNHFLKEFTVGSHGLIPGHI